jgi:hypothetical protein
MQFLGSTPKTVISTDQRERRNLSILPGATLLLQAKCRGFSATAAKSAAVGRDDKLEVIS